MTEAMHITVDTSLCAGLGECARVAPDLFLIDGSGIARATTDTVSVERAAKAAASCPMAAIMVARATEGAA